MADRRKPIAFDTTMRNPARMASFVSILRDFDGEQLTNEVIFKIEAEFIRQKIYEPTGAVLGNYIEKFDNKYEAQDKSVNAPEKVSKLYDDWKNSDIGKIKSEDIIYLLKNTITKHQERGYEYGWESRFKTQVSFIVELGFALIEKMRL